MKFLSVCSGIEAVSVAWEPLGWEAVAFSEIEPFPCAVLADAPTGRMAMYYGCADTVTGLCFCQVDELIDFIKANSKV